MAYTTIDKPSDYFNTKIFTGDNSANNSVTGVGFQPDWIWFKNRDAANDHALVNSVRGRKSVSTNNANAELTLNADKDFQSFDSDGFTVDVVEQLNSFNKSGDSIVTWNWLAGTSFTNDASSTGVGSLDSAGSVNETAGFAIVTYTGNGSSGATIKHGLSTVPTAMFVRQYNASAGFQVYNVGTGNTKFAGYLNVTDAAGTTAGAWNNTTPTSSVFTVGNGGNTNTNNGLHIAYIFSERQGYSKFGSYAANESVDGTFIYTGFKPAFVILKQSNLVRDWHMFDNKRSTFNAVGKYLRPNEAGSEDSGEEYLDFLSNGFKIKNTGNRFNDAGGTYTYYAWAEQPFVNSKGVPANAR
jgi:hypothetical protein